MQIPTDDEIRALHERFAPSRAAFELVWTHCRIVCELAEELFVEGDLVLVRAGSLLHDIGVYRLQPADNYVRHGILGHELLRDVGLPEALCRFCSHHTGVGITRADVLDQGLPLPAEDFLAETAEEELVMYADKFHSKTSPPRFLTADTYAAKVGRFGAGKVEHFAELRKQYGEPDLAGAAQRYGHTVI
ncbi:HD domain-containing protein [Actinoplanes sp. NBC_00393]|uniref:HD domain-containing protein n=1 Tax=Actinoplanes sp. NBC_00393 TaxID=2975953 RepID=UPI002E24B18F